MKTTRNILLLTLLFFIGILLVFAVSNYFGKGLNWDANIIPNADKSNTNDVFSIGGRLDIEDSRTVKYDNGYRGKISGTIDSDLFGLFEITDGIDLTFKSSTNIRSECGNSLEIYNIIGKITSSSWGEMLIDESESYFCSNNFTYIKLNSASLGDKEIGSDQGVDDFGKQQIYISGIANLKGDLDILNRGNDKINVLGVSVTSKTINKQYINKNIAMLFKTYAKLLDTTFSIDDIENNTKKYHLYDYSSEENTIYFNSNEYKNKGKILQIGDDGGGKVGIDGEHTIIVKSGNIYINSNLYNINNSSLLILTAKKGKDGKGGNIYINPGVTNIDAILIADGSLISLSGEKIQMVGPENQINNLRKQLLIYGSVLSSNIVGTDEIPYGADLYEDISYSNNIMENNIYDLGNLRTFNLNYGGGGDCTETGSLVPIDGTGGYLQNAWAGRKECYIDDDGDDDLRKSDRKNPIIIEYNNRIKLINPMLLRIN